MPMDATKDLGSTISVMPFSLGVGTGFVSDLVLLIREMGFSRPGKPLFPQGPILQGVAVGVCSCCIFITNTGSKEELLADVWSGFSFPCPVTLCSPVLFHCMVTYQRVEAEVFFFFPLLSLGLVISLFGFRCMFFWTVISWDPSKSDAPRADADFLLAKKEFTIPVFNFPLYDIR